MGVEGELAAHELNNTLTEEQTKTKSFSEHVNLGEFVEDKGCLVGRDARPRVFYGEEHIVVGGFNTHGDTSFVGEVKGIKKQLGEDDEQMMAVGLDGKFIGNATVKVHLDSMTDEAACTVESLVCQFIAIDGVVGADGLMAFDE